MSEMGPPLGTGAGSGPRPEIDDCHVRAAVERVRQTRLDGVVRLLHELAEQVPLAPHEHRWLAAAWLATRVLVPRPGDAAGQLRRGLPAS
jgi:hypothetical protein